MRVYVLTIVKRQAWLLCCCCKAHYMCQSHSIWWFGQKVGKSGCWNSCQ